MSSRQSAKRRTQGLAERAEAIVAAARELIVTDGLGGATISRIAKVAGISEGGIYRHFSSRTEILVAVLESIYSQVRDLFRASSTDDPVADLRDLMRSNARLMADPTRSFARPWLEIVASAPDGPLRDKITELQAREFAPLEDLVERAKASGQFRPDTDTDQLVWAVLTWAWGQNVISALALNEPEHLRRSLVFIDQIIDSARS